MTALAITGFWADSRPRFLEGLTPSDLRAVLAAATQRRVQAKSIITNHGDIAQQFFLLTKGRARFFYKWLEKAISIAPSGAEPVYALGLLKVRQKQYPEALGFLAKAAKLQPANVRYGYVYAVALQSSGHAGQAITILQQAHERRPADRQILTALVSFERDQGNLPAAIAYAKQLIQLEPDDPNSRTLLGELLGQGH